MRLVLLVLAALAAPVLAQAPDLPPAPAPFRVAPAPEATLVTDPAPEVDAVRAGSAPTPASFAFQGVLEDAGQPVADGTYSVAIRLFAVATGGTAVYAETHSATTTGGVFAVSVGTGTPTSGAFTSVNFSEAVWLEVAVGGTTLSPRTAVQPAPVAQTLVGGADIRTSRSGSSVLRVTNDATTTASYGGRFESYAPSGRGVYGRNYATTGTAEGVFGYTSSSAGSGVYGLADATTGETNGVYGRTQSTSGRGVYGVAVSTSGGAIGGQFETRSAQGTAVYALATSTASDGGAFGVYGETNTPGGAAIYGTAQATTGNAIGVRGAGRSTIGVGVYGEATSQTGTTFGVVGTVTSPDGYSGRFYNGRGIRVSLGNAYSVATTAFENDAIVAEGEDAVLGLYSNASLTWGSAISLGEVGNAGVLANKWTIQRNTGAAGSLHFTFGTNSNYGFNNTVLRIDTDGSVHADGAFTGGGADLAEFFPLAATSSPEAVRPGDLVGLRGGAVSLAASGAEQVMIASSDPAFVGNPAAEAGGALVALVGQAEVRITGPASVGDLLVASGLNDGTARAVSPESYRPEADGPVAGRVLALPEAGRAVALVGVDEAAALRTVVERQQAIIEGQAARLDAQQAQIDALTRRLDALTATTAAR